jgi:HD-GYP domain-containing protein (c-di-GMP phosphodiesterase class II)
MALLALADTARRISTIHRHPPAPARARLTAEALLTLLDRHAPGVRRHMDRTAALCRPVAECLGLSARLVDVVVRTAAVHDIGKLVLPAELLSKQGPLEAWEWELVRQHPVVGQRLLDCVPEARGIAGIVRATHERYDGKGYPDGLRGRAIPLPARIVAVCDAFDAMTEERPYRRAVTVRWAAEELWRGSGTQFDPKVTEALCEVIRPEM